MKDGNPGELLTQRGGWHGEEGGGSRGVEREHEKVGPELRLLIMDSVTE